MRALEYRLSHPHTRAERRRLRQQRITRSIQLSYKLVWFTGTCQCQLARPGKEYPCWVHRNQAFYRQVNQYAKTGPYNWYRESEQDWFMQGVLRRDYRAGGGRRPSSQQIDWGGGMRGAGTFKLRTALKEWDV